MIFLWATSYLNESFGRSTQGCKVFFGKVSSFNLSWHLLRVSRGTARSRGVEHFSGKKTWSSCNHQIDKLSNMEECNGCFMRSIFSSLVEVFKKNALSAPPRTRLTPIKVWRMIYYWRLAKKVESCAPQVLWKQTWLASVVKLHSFTRESD